MTGMNANDHRTYAPDTIPLPAGARFEPPSEDAFHDAWVDACLASRAAYRAWRSAAADQRRDAYAVYVAAEDREQAAAEAFARAVAA